MNGKDCSKRSKVDLQPKSVRRSDGVTRRAFLKTGAIGAAGLVSGAAWGQNAPAGQPVSGVDRSAGRVSGSKPNILFISADQLGREALSGSGCVDVSTPNIDRLIQGGTSFGQCYTANPLCSPARSSWFTGRMPSETGVVKNTLSIRPGIPTMGYVLRSAGYETYYCGKWHLPREYAPSISGFEVYPAGISVQAHSGDTAVSQACQGFLDNHLSQKPFLMVASLLQPHDICRWVTDHRESKSEELPLGLGKAELPDLPSNFHYDAREPKKIPKRPEWTPMQWRYYLWSYYRHVEMVDAEIGRILDALDGSPYADNTVIVFTSDHGEGRGRHQTVMKNFLYDEAVTVPLVFSWPGQIAQGARDGTHLISSTDFLPTMCDYAGAATPAGVVGRSLRPLLEGANPSWRDMVAAEVVVTGRMIRTDQYKYITYRGDPVEQLFDMKVDPGETRNLAGEAQFASALDDHRNRLKEWESRLDLAPQALVTEHKKKKANVNSDENE